MLSWVMGELSGGVLEGQGKVAFSHKGTNLKLLLLLFLYIRSIILVMS